VGQQVWPRVPHIAIIGWQLPLTHANPEPHGDAPGQHTWLEPPQGRQVPPAHAREEPQAIPLVQHGCAEPPQTTVPESAGGVPPSVPMAGIWQVPLMHVMAPAHAGPDIQHA